MLLRSLSVSALLLLAGCATFPMAYNKAPPPRPTVYVATPHIVIHPAAPAAAPFKKRWLDRFFIKRATEK